MIWIALGVLVLLLGVGGMRAFSEMSVAQVKRAGALFLGLLGLVLLVAALVSGRGGQALWFSLLLGPALLRWWRARRLSAGFSAPEAPEEGPGEGVETAMLRMRLDPATGTLSGEVRAGRFAGRDLAALSLEELRALLAEAGRHDPESAPLVEAWLDRVHPGWREAPGEGGARRPGGGGMDRAEALAVLGLAEAAGEAEIRAAHARLMRAAHPDAGGSDWLASRLNAARDVLLRR